MLYRPDIDVIIKLSTENILTQQKFDSTLIDVSRGHEIVYAIYYKGQE